MSAFRDELRRNPLLWRAVQLSAAAAFGTALPDIIDFAHRVLW